MKVYIAGKLGTEHEREQLETVEKMCRKFGFETFLPHRDVGLAETPDDIAPIFQGDIEKSLPHCSLIIALLDGLHVGAGTAWELGYAYAKGIPAVGIKTDEPPLKAMDYLSPILLGAMPIVTSMKELEAFLRDFVKSKN